jgi:hypothetical protein
MPVKGVQFLQQQTPESGNFDDGILDFDVVTEAVAHCYYKYMTKPWDILGRIIPNKLVSSLRSNGSAIFFCSKVRRPSKDN